MIEPAVALVISMLLAVAVQTAISLALRRWGLSVARKHSGVWWQRMTWAPMVALALAMAGMAMTSYIMLRTFGRLADGEPSTKATELARGISSAMNVTAAFALPTWALYLASSIVCLVGWLRRPTD